MIQWERRPLDALLEPNAMRAYDNPKTTAANLRKSRLSKEDKKSILYCIGCLIPIALVVAAPVACYHYFFSDAAHIRRYGKTTTYRANFHCAIRENEAMIVNGSYFVSDGSIDLFKKEGEKWRLTRHVDITKYLKGSLVTHINSNDIESCERYEYKTPLVFNEQYVVVLAWKSDVPKILHFDMGPGSGVGTAIIFKRVGDDLEYFSSIHNLIPRRISLSDDNRLLVASQTQIGLKEYDLNAAYLKVVQTIEPPIVSPEEARNSYGAKENESRSFGSGFIQKGDYLLVESRQKVPMDERERSKGFGLSDDYLLYRKVDGEWRYVQSLLDHIPRETYRALQADPLSGLNRCDFGNERFQLSFINYLCDQKGLIEFQRDETTGLFEVANVDFKEFLKDEPKDRRRLDSHDDETRVNLVVQERNNASLAVMNKATQLGILPPSHDAPPEVAAPKWTILAGDPETTATMVDHYKKGDVSSFIPGWKSGKSDVKYDNFYDYVDAVPTLHYAINSSDMVVSYVFKDCFFSGWPMQDACDVWAGVDFYRIDDELGPIKVSSFVTRDLKPLAPRKTPASEPGAVP